MIMLGEQCHQVALASLCAGTVAGASGILVGHPLDSLKVRLQVGRVLAAKWNMSYLMQLYRGIAPPMLTTGLLQSINFTVFESSKIHLTPYFHEIYYGKVFASGTISGAVISLLAGPISIVKIQQQVAMERGLSKCVSDIYNKGGLRAFYRSYTSVFILESPGRGIYMFCYEYGKVLTAKLYHRFGKESMQSESLNCRVISAALSGMIAWLAVYPFDVIKARMQLDFTRETYKSTLQCFQKLVAESGARGLYRGMGFTMVRAAPVAGTVMPIYDFTRDYVYGRLQRLSR